MTKAMMKIDEAYLLPAICRQSFGAFCYKAFSIVYPNSEIEENFHIDSLCYRLQQMVEGKADRRLVLNQPPRSLKSFIVSVCLPAWVLGHKPSSAIVVASYAEDLAIKFSRECRTLAESDYFKWVFPDLRLNPRKMSETEFTTMDNGYRMTASVGGTLTGRGADLLIVDDPIKAQDAYSEKERDRVLNWFNTTALTRRNSAKKCLIIVAMQRLHEEDLAGKLTQNSWPSIVVPAIAMENEIHQLAKTLTYTRKTGEILQFRRDSQQDLEDTKRQIGSHDFEAQYQQNPLPTAGNIVKAAWLTRYEELPQINYGADTFITCDPASKPGEQNDFTAILAATIIKNNLYILDVARGHWTMAEMRKRIEEFTAHHKARIVEIEDTAIGPGLIQDLRANTRISVRPCKPQGSKEERLRGRIGPLESGRVFFPRDKPWSADFERELLGFPSTKYDDQVDAFIMALERFARAPGLGQVIPLVGPIIVTGQKSHFDRPHW